MRNLITKLLLLSFFLTAFLGVSVKGALGAYYLSLSLHHEAPYIHTGETLQFSAHTYPSYDCSTPCYSWEITEVGSYGSTIDANGLYTAGYTAGTDVVTVTDACNGDISDSTQVSVGPIPTSTYEFERMWPTLTQPWYFHEVGHIAVDSNGFVYVSDNIDSCIKKFTSDGQFVTKWGSYCDIFDGSGCEDPDGDGPLELGDGQFNIPVEIAVDINGFVYVVDYGSSLHLRIQKFTSDGQFVTKWGSDDSVDDKVSITGGIAVDGNGFFYFVDFSPGRILKFTSDGQFVTQWGSDCDLYDGSGCEDPDGDGPLELGDGQFNFPSGIAVDINGFVYVSDDNHRIQKFTLDGEFVAKWGSGCRLRNGSGCEDPDGDGPLELGDGQFYDMYNTISIAVDINGFVYAGDGGNGRIQQFTSDGQFVAKWGSNCYMYTGSGCEDPDGDGPLELGDGEFDGINDIAVGGNGFVYVVEAYWNSRIQKFTLDGQFVDKWQSYGDGDGEFHSPTDINIDTNGFVYVGESHNSRIQKFTPDGQFLEELESHGKLKAIDDNNFFYYIDNSLIKKVASAGEIVAQWGRPGTGDGEFEVIRDLAVDNSGYVYVLDSPYTNYGYDPVSYSRIQKFTSDGQFVTKWGSYCDLRYDGYCEDPDGDGPLELGDGQFFSPRSIAVDMNGFVYVSDWNGRIQEFTPDGQFVDKWNASCEDLAIDSNGFLYCTYNTDNMVPSHPNVYFPISVLKFTLEGQFLGKWGHFGSNPGQMFWIGGIAVGPNAKIYITDRNNHRVQVFEETPSITGPLGCERDADCDDESFCNGAETCVGGSCQEGEYPCAEPTPACDEESDLCVEGPSIQLLPNPYMQSRWMPMVLLLRIVGTDTHFDRSSRVTFDPLGAVMALPIVGDDEHLLMIGILMPAWLMFTQSIDVTVTTGAEVVSEELYLEFPFMMNKQTDKLIDVTH